MYATTLPLTLPSPTDEHRLQLLEDATLMLRSLNVIK